MTNEDFKNIYIWNLSKGVIFVWSWNTGGFVQSSLWIFIPQLRNFEFLYEENSIKMYCVSNLQRTRQQQNKT